MATTEPIKFEIDVQPFLDIVKSSTDRLQGLTVCMEALDVEGGLSATIKAVDEEVLQDEDIQDWELSDENLAVAAARRAELLSDIHASVAAIVSTDRHIAKLKAAAKRKTEEGS